MHRFAWSMFLLLPTLGLAGSASAFSIFPNPVVDDDGAGTTITVTQTGFAVGSGFGETVLDGAIGGLDVSLIFTVSVSGPGALDGGVQPDFQVGLIDDDGGCFGFACATAVGAINPPSGDAVASASLQSFGAYNLGADIFFDTDVGPNSTSQEFFVTFDRSSFDLDGSESFALMVAIDSGVPFNITPAPLLVPEPSTALLLGLGLLSCAQAARRRRS